MMLLLAAIMTAGLQGEEAVREQIETTIRTNFEADEIRALSRMTGAYGVIMKMIKEDEKKLLPLVEILGRIKSKEAESYILGLLDHTSPAVRVASAGALGRLETKKATERIAALLSDPAIIEADKAIVARTLGELGDVKALNALQGYRDSLTKRKVQLGGPNINTNHAITKLETLACADPVQKEKRLADLLLAKHENGETLDLRIWAAERLADLQCKNAPSMIRSAVAEIPGDGEPNARMLKSLKRLGGKLTNEEHETLRKHE